MPVLTEAQVRSALHKHNVPPVLVLAGDDEVGKEPLIQALSDLVEADLQAFNLQRLYANERSLEQIVAAARTLPFLGTRRVIIALRCEAFLKSKGKAGAARDDDGDGDTSKEEEPQTSKATAELERYLNAPSPENVLVLVASDFSRNTRLAKQLVKSAAVVEYWGLKTERDAKGRAVADALYAAERFVRETVKSAKLNIRADAIEPLIEHAGTDINVLRNDLEKLVNYCAGRTDITLADVRAVVGGAVQIDEWALTRAIQDGKAAEALRHLHLGLEAGQAPMMLLGQLGWLVRTRLAQQMPARAAAAVDALMRADTALKSSAGDPRVLMERLVVELCGTKEGRPTAGRPAWRG